MFEIKDNFLIPVLFVVGALLGHYFGYWLGFGDFLILPFGLLGFCFGIYFSYEWVRIRFKKALGG
ncbi:MAG TPA: hypothetical protein PKN54_05735 [Candidatus Cloacimonas acidaminovorans]|nr:hypothetical protein [Candidatus Cloacimonas acidaminovorans]